MKNEKIEVKPIEMDERTIEFVREWKRRHDDVLDYINKNMGIPQEREGVPSGRNTQTQQS